MLYYKYIYVICFIYIYIYTYLIYICGLDSITVYIVSATDRRKGKVVTVIKKITPKEDMGDSQIKS